VGVQPRGHRRDRTALSLRPLPGSAKGLCPCSTVGLGGVGWVESSRPHLHQFKGSQPKERLPGSMVVARPQPPQEPLMVIQLNAMARQLQTLFSQDADRLAHQAHLIRRQRQLTGSAFAQGLVFGWLDKPQPSLDHLVCCLARAGVRLKPQSLDQRFSPAAAEFFRLLLGQALGQAVAASDRSAVPLLRRFRGVYLLDSTLISLPAALAGLLPGTGGKNDAPACQASLKITVRFELAAGCLDGVHLNPGKTADAKTALQQAPLPQGALRLADLGFFDLDLL